MPAIKCPIPGCDYSTDDVDATIVVQLLQLHQVAHVQPQSSPTSAAKVEKFKRPSISISGTSEEWSYFRTRWDEYVAATGIKGTDRVIQLLECCDEELRRDLTLLAGGSLTTKDEKTVLEAIQKLAVRVENIMVTRVALHDMHQDRDEPVRIYSARLRGQANICQFTVECPDCRKNVDYTHHIVRDCIIRGISDDNIRLDVLGNENQNMDQDALVSYIESKEAGKRSISRISSSQSAAAARSSYRNQRTSSLRGNTEKCSHCGTIGHGDGSNKRSRKEKCPAYGQTCAKCTRKHHLSSVCKSRRKPQPQTSTPDDTTTSTSATIDKQDGAFSSLCSINSDTTLGLRSVILDHHLYDNMCNRWSCQPSKAQPFINLAMSTHKDDYQALGFTMTCPPCSCTLQGMADTGCQSCLCGLQIIRKLGMSEKDLIPVTMRMHAANKQDIKILGAAIVRLCGISKTGKQLQTRQILYVTDNADKLFISREACIALGMISKDFPQLVKWHQLI